ncbi:arabinosylfuranosidase ArfA [Frondihabitans cladoniiphilus]|uniref:non-reducing end alpha-L-arabinofuranosidase n=1 Tax=Frondihabitans cladoniiphilus TaxID=715785 RepID=A0ABP8VLN6_9MICO
MLTARIHIDPSHAIAEVPRRLFGSFVEHLGRAVYTGVYEPSHPTADAGGFRQDVAALVAELGPTIVRYPGGNFVSGYRWEDGVGPVADRPTRLDAAWHSRETNEVGLHEFAGWASARGIELMQAVNLGTRGMAEAADLLEYSNHPSGTELSDRRRRNGADQPFGITVWCLGNEMDGPWQIGHRTAAEYGRIAAETGRLMKWIDPSIELVAAGSSNADMPTFGDWERTVLREAGDVIDHISVHAYYEEVDGDVASFLASGVALDAYIDDVARIIDEIAVETGSTKKIGIAVDEWNVWYQTRFNEVDKAPLFEGPWDARPRLLEDEYSVTDAVVVGSLLNSLIRHSDRVSMANLAQLVNVIAPIRSEPGGPAWRQTTFFPFQRAAAFARGSIVAASLEVEAVDGGRHGEVPAIDCVVTLDEQVVTVLVTNRSLDEAAEVTLAGLPTAVEVVSAETLTVPEGGDRHTSNTEAAPDAVGMVPLAARVDGGVVLVTLPPLSWSILRVRFS